MTDKSTPTRGKFICLEGGDATGKGTQSKRLIHWLEQRGIEVVHTREPGGTAQAEYIRQLILSNELTGISTLAELLLFFAGRADHCEQLIRPALERGAWVLSERFTYSTIIYQGGDQQQWCPTILQLAETVHGDLWPDLVFFMDQDIEVGLQRRIQRSLVTDVEQDRIEQKKREFHERVRQGYRSMLGYESPLIKTNLSALLDALPGHQSTQMVEIDSAQPLEEVTHAMLTALEQFMDENNELRLASA